MAIALLIVVACGGSEKPTTTKPTAPEPAASVRTREAVPKGKVTVDEYSPSGLLFQDGPRPKLHQRITQKTLEDEATALIRFHQRTGRRCPSKAERQELMIGSDSLEALSHYVSLDCEHFKGFTLVLFGKAGIERMAYLHNGCRIITIPGNPIGPFLPARPDPVVQDRHQNASLHRELAQCVFAPYSTVTVCHRDDCNDTELDDWLASHPDPNREPE